MRSILTGLFFTLCLLHQVHGQSLVSRWQYDWGGSRQETMANMIPLPGNQYLFAGTSASDPATCNKTGPYYGGKDFAIFVLDDNGNKLWEKTYGGNGDDQLEYAAKVPSGGYILVGETESSPSGIKTSPAYGGGDIWVVRVDDNGTLLWEKTYGGVQYERGQKVIPSPDGGFLIAGISSSPFAGYNNGSGDYLVMKLDAGGNALWTKYYGGSNDDELQDIIPTADGNYLLSGYSKSLSDGNKTAPSLGGSDNWIVCISPDGTRLWDKTYGSSADEGDCTLLALQDGNYLITGYTANVIGVIRKIDGQGNEIWNHTCPGQGFFYKSVQTTNGNIYVGGQSSGDIGDCKTSPLTGGNADLWIVEYDPQGNKIGDMDYGGNNADLITDIEAVNDEIWAIATTSSDQSGNKTVPRCGVSLDGWIIRLTRQLYIQSPTPTDLCNNITSFSVSITAYSPYQAGNTFTAQLSDARGSFASAVDIGNLTATASGLIPVTLPANLPASDQYKIRVVASLPTDTTSVYTLSLHGPPQVSLGNDTAICTSKPFTLSPGPQPPGTQYQWNDGSTGSTLTVSSPATWSCAVQNSCGTVSDEIKVTARPLPAAFLPSDTSLCSYEDLTLTATLDFQTYQWSTGSISPSIHITQPGLYWLRGTDQYGCTGADSFLVSPKQCLTGFFMPSAFSPNQDGKNDLCRPLLYGRVRKFNFAVYSRWGQKIFETADPTRGWDGNVNGHAAAIGTYLWTCTYQLDGSGEQHPKGAVILIR